MKKQIALILAVLMLIATIPFASAYETIQPLAIYNLELDVPQEVYIPVAEIPEPEDEISFAFVPEETGKYLFYSTGAFDTYCYLQDNSLEIIAQDDDSGEGGNFSLLCELEAGKLYYFVVNTFDDESRFEVCLTKSKDIHSIRVLQKPFKTRYINGYDAGETIGGVDYYYLDLAGLTLEVNFSDGSSSTVEYADNPGLFEIEEPVALGLGENRISLVYMGMGTDFSVWLTDSLVKSVEVVSPPDNTTYYDGFDNQWGFSIDSTGLQVRIHYADGTSVLVDKDYHNYNIELTYDSIDLGENTITVSVDGAVDTFSLFLVEMPAIESIDFPEVLGMLCQKGFSYVEVGADAVIRFVNGDTRTGYFSQKYTSSQVEPGENQVTIQIAGVAVPYKLILQAEDSMTYRALMKIYSDYYWTYLIGATVYGDGFCDYDGTVTPENADMLVMSALLKAGDSVLQKYYSKADGMYHVPAAIAQELIAAMYTCGIVDISDAKHYNAEEDAYVFRYGFGGADLFTMRYQSLPNGNTEYIVTDYNYDAKMIRFEITQGGKVAVIEQYKEPVKFTMPDMLAMIAVKGDTQAELTFPLTVLMSDKTEISEDFTAVFDVSTLNSGNFNMPMLYNGFYMYADIELQIVDTQAELDAIRDVYEIVKAQIPVDADGYALYTCDVQTLAGGRVQYGFTDYMYVERCVSVILDGDGNFESIAPYGDFTLKGTLSSDAFKSDVTLVLSRNGETVKTLVVPAGGGKTLSFSFEGVAAGYYTVTASKAGGLDYTVTDILVAYGNETMPQMFLNTGDVTGDGAINLEDIAMILKTENFNKLVADAADPACDLDGDGMINTSDLSIALSTLNYNKMATTVSYEALKKASA